MNNSYKNKAALLRTKLEQSLVPTTLEIIDEGEQHRGHAEEGAGHFKIQIASPLFANKSLVECHRLIYKALGTTIGTDIHALRIEIVES
ncbi:BolA family protein [Rickettsiella massiliensis]|uniref:BolA family protein n=1 Tax=Rickettsiella massiliensis TaxID=676517 RepID=UPI00029A91F5|nr:BolA family protein [Rickettsiella massiliensis]